MKLVWAQRALEDRRAIFDYIEADDPRAAVLVDDRIAAATRRLFDFPDSGRPDRVEGTRELVIARTPYIAPYRIEGDVVRIVRVIHGARIWPDVIPDDDEPAETAGEFLRARAGGARPADLLPFLDSAANEPVAAGDVR